MTPTAVIDRVAVTWRPDAEPGAVGRDRLARLGRRLAGGGLGDALGDALGSSAGVQVCVRRIASPVYRMRWDAPDDELVAGWADAVGRAVATAVAGRGTDVVSYPSRAHARRDLVTALLDRSRERVWAWRLLGLWPAAGEPDPDDVLRQAVAEIGHTEPEEAVGLLVAVAGAGTLPHLVLAVGAEAVVALVAAAWQAVGGAGGNLHAALALPDLPGPAEPAADRPIPPDEAIAGPDTAPDRADPAPVVIPAAGTRAAAWLAAHVRSRSVVAAAARAVRMTVEPDALTVALAAAALLEVEPAAAAGPSAAATVRALAARPAPPSCAPGGTVPPGRPPALGDPPAVVVGTPDAPGTPPTPDVPPAPPGVPTRDRATTAWGGLLFLAPLVAEVGLPDRATADPARYGPALRPVLHGLARRLVARAVPDAGPAEPDDPAVLAFAGLAPTAEPPRDPVDPALLDAEGDLLLAALRDHLAPAPLADADERALLVAVARRHAVIEADPGWIDVLLELDEVSVDVRRAGLDVDPGHLPWLGCVLRYRYG